MPRRAYILVTEEDDVICQVASRNGRPRLATFAEAERTQVDLRSRYGLDHQYNVYAIVPITARVMLEPLEPLPNEPTPRPDRSSGASNREVPSPTPELLERMRQDITLSGRATVTSGSSRTRPRPEPAPEDIARLREEAEGEAIEAERQGHDRPAEDDDPR